MPPSGERPNNARRESETRSSAWCSVVRPLAAYVVVCTALGALAWTFYVWEPMGQILSVIGYQLRFPGGLLSSLLGINVSLPVLVLGFLVELSPSFGYAVTGRRTWLRVQGAVLVVHIVGAVVLYLSLGTWLD